MFEDELYHYGKGHLDGGKSGRYPWGSGEDPYQTADSWAKEVRRLKTEVGMTDSEIAKFFNITNYKGEGDATMLNAYRSIARYTARKELIDANQALIDSGYTNRSERARMLDTKESTLRELEASGIEGNPDKTRVVADSLKSLCDKYQYGLDVGAGSELELNTTSTRMKVAMAMLQAEEGYNIYNVKVQQPGTGKYTTMQVLAKPDTTWAEIANNVGEVGTITDYITNDGKTCLGILPPVALDRSRVFVRYGEDGGADRDGTIELRRGVEDISLDGSAYAQVRINVDDKFYMKGMAHYSDNIPEGYDLVYNSNKPIGSPDDKVFKPLKTIVKDDPSSGIDWDNPFGASIKMGVEEDGIIKRGGQRIYTDENGVQHQSVINKLQEEGDWSNWSKTLSSQFLSKQDQTLVKSQLNAAYEDRADEFKDILSVTNPVVKKKLLESFADECDSAAVELRGAALPRQASHVLLPMQTLKDNEIYAPNYNDGEKVVLIRFPHQGIFEIPECVVNNKNDEGRKIIGSKAVDAVGISLKTAQQLSGADFDGDTAIVIPVNDKVRVRTQKANAELMAWVSEMENYKTDDPKKYKINKGNEMGKISNLINDMTLQDAPMDEVVRAVKQAQLVIDVEKHHYDWRQCRKDLNIQELVDKYQIKEDGRTGGAATLISRSSSDKRILENSTRYTIDPETGKKTYEKTGREYQVLKMVSLKDEKGKVVKDGDGNTIKVPAVDELGNKIYETKLATQKTTKMADTDDARTLLSKNPNPKEILYANYANQCKALANEARKASLRVDLGEKDPEMAKLYAEEVASLTARLNTAKKNQPRERKAIAVTNAVVKAKINANPSLKEDKDALKKIKNQALAQARAEYGASKTKVLIRFTDKEWEAVQKRAISPSKLSEILRYSDEDHYKKLATPHDTNTGLTSGQIATIKRLMANDQYTNADIAKRFNISTSTLSKISSGEI